tara:strand:- start:288 stop:518 length:231 start_codon:yes stop_codon:yes gene_type:complete
MSESKDYEKEEKEQTEKHEVVRVTSLKTNGSVWTKSYESNIDYNVIIPILLDKFPHILLSKQVLKKSPMEFLIDME